MNKNTKIIIGVGVGLGLAYLLFGRKKAKKTAPATPPQVAVDVKLPDEIKDVAEEDALNDPQTREEQIAFIMENTQPTNQEQFSGFEGVKFVWNPKLGRYYPKGVINEGEMPSYAENVFSGYEGVDDLFIGFEGDIDPVQESASSLNELSDKELDLATNIVKMKKFSPSEMTDQQALREISDNDPKLQEIVQTRIAPRLNDVKVMKKMPLWRRLFKKRKQAISSIKEKAKTCGRRPLFGREKIAQWKSCIKGVSMKRANQRDRARIRAKAFRGKLTQICGQKPQKTDGQRFAQWKECSNRVKAKKGIMNSASKGASVKSSFSGVDYNEARQNEFTRQVTNRMSGGMFAGRRFDGRTNLQEESLVRQGIV